LRLLFARFPNRISLPGKGRPVGLRNDLFEACSAFTLITACTLAGSPKATPYIGGFSYFVTSIAAPIASGRSDLAGWDFHPLEKRRLITAHAHRRHAYQVNFAQALSKMKNTLTELLLLSARKLQGKLEALIDYIACTIEPIRRGRSYSRTNSKSKNRIFYCNYKRAK